MKIAFATVLYPAGLKFWNDFIISIKNQTYQKFELIVLNDGCDISAINTYGINIEFIEAKGTIIENRNQLINYLIDKKFDWVVFGDCDDYFKSNRVEHIISLMDNYDLIANDIVSVNNFSKSSKIFSKNLGAFCNVNLDFIREKNLFGLSNVACKIDFLKNIKLSNDLVAADWYLFTRVLMNKARACFTNGTITYYRQWEANIIGIENETRQKIVTGIKAKYIHFKLMSELDIYYQNALPWLEKLYNSLMQNDIDSYLEASLNSKEESVFWWENIKNI